MTEANAAEAAARALIEALTPYELPTVILIGLPKTDQFIRVANGMSQEGNRVLFAQEFVELMKLHAQPGEAPAEEGGAPDAPLILQTDLRFKDCPVCLGSGKDVAESELNQAPCECCGGRGRVCA